MICTEQERDALMAHVKRYGHARDRAAHEREMGDYEALKRWNKSAREYCAAIRAILAPPDDAVVRERLVSMIADFFDGSEVTCDRDHDVLAERVLSVLRGEATRDETQ